MSVLGKRDLAPSDRVVSLLVVPFKIVTAVMMRVVLLKKRMAVN